MDWSDTNVNPHVDSMNTRKTHHKDCDRHQNVPESEWTNPGLAKNSESNMSCGIMQEPSKPETGKYASSSRFDTEQGEQMHTFDCRKS